MSFENILNVSEDFNDCETFNCMCCRRDGEPTKMVTMLWNERPRRKNGGGSYWSSLNDIPLCTQCIEHDQEYLVGWDWWDAMDSFSPCPKIGQPKLFRICVIGNENYEFMQRWSGKNDIGKLYQITIPDKNIELRAIRIDDIDIERKTKFAVSLEFSELIICCGNPPPNTHFHKKVEITPDLTSDFINNLLLSETSFRDCIYKF